jgi:hypothetical protein
MVAFALREDGWHLRSEIIWYKPNQMPESVNDRPTKAHEQVFLLARSEHYFYDADAIREPMLKGAAGSEFHTGKTGLAGLGRASTRERHDHPLGRNKRSVWTIPTQPFLGAHFATFPEKLVELCLRAGTSVMGCCARCGAPRERVVQRGTPDKEWQRACGATQEGTYEGVAQKEYAAIGVQDASAVKARILAGLGPRMTVAWRPTCSCLFQESVPCTVLDPFTGSGTTGLVALRLQQNFIGIELNPAYVAMSRKRLRDDMPLFNRETESGESAI